MAGSRIEVEAVDGSELGDPLQRLGRESLLALEGVEHDALEEIAEGHILVVGKGPQHLEEALLQPDAGLHSLDLDLDAFGPARHYGLHGNLVTRYLPYG